MPASAVGVKVASGYLPLWRMKLPMARFRKELSVTSVLVSTVIGPTCEAAGWAGSRRISPATLLVVPMTVFGDPAKISSIWNCACEASG